jgi:hypothetical protein
LVADHVILMPGRRDASRTSEASDFDGGTMALHEEESLTFRQGDEKALPHTLSETRHLTLTLIDFSASAGTAVFELHNPEAQQDELVGGLISENEEDVEDTNRWRDKLRLPEKPVPVDVSTKQIEELHCQLHEKLQIGDRVWVVTEITADQVKLTPGRDHEAHSLVNAAEDLEYQPAAIAGEQDLNTIDKAL